MTIDCRGKKCPVPVVEVKKAMEKLNHTGILEILVDEEIAVSNLEKLANSQNASFAAEDIENGATKITMELKGGAGESNDTNLSDMGNSCAPINKKTAVVFKSATMGIGNDELGAILVKGYIFALSQQEKLPDYMLFYNGGVNLTIDGSASLEDLQNMEKAGVKILSCGTCLDYYNVKDKLSVGAVTNLYELAEIMTSCDNVITP